MKKKLPLGIQTLREILDNNYLYVDKTKEITELITTGKYYFISRPRRFGKSLLVSTLKEIFEGNQELFKGLYIYDKIEWKKHPVIKVDFTGISYSDDTVLRKSLTSFIENTAQEYNIILNNKFVGDSFQELLKRISEEQKTKVVILIDEYDKPIIDKLPDTTKAAANREVLREFYGAIKGADPYLKFVFITGVSKFAQVSIFSGLNNLDDITLNSKFATIVGITEEELRHAFRDFIPLLCTQYNTSPEIILADIKHWYNGYSWDGSNRVYNPFSLLKLFSLQSFSNYWFATGTPTFLINILKEKNYAIPEIEHRTASDTTFNSYDIDSMDITALLFQTGYITLKEIRKLASRENFYTLGYPNFEVKESLQQYIFTSFTSVGTPKVKPLIEDMKDALSKNDIDTYLKYIRSIIAGIPYTLTQDNEAYYHTVFYLIASLMGLHMETEVLTNHGRIDGVLELDTSLYVIEFKYRKTSKSPKSLLKEALTQIKQKKYYEKYLHSKKPVFFLAIALLDKAIHHAIEKL